MVAVAVFSVRSERTPAVCAATAVSGVLLAGHLAFSLHAKTGWSDLALVPWVAAAAATGRPRGPRRRTGPCSWSGPVVPRKAGSRRHADGCSRSGCG
jgi:hypothetical protein